MLLSSLIRLLIPILFIIFLFIIKLLLFLRHLFCRLNNFLSNIWFQIHIFIIFSKTSFFLFILIVIIPIIRNLIPSKLIIETLKTRISSLSLYFLRIFHLFIEIEILTFNRIFTTLITILIIFQFSRIRLRVPIIAPRLLYNFFLLFRQFFFFLQRTTFIN